MRPKKRIAVLDGNEISLRIRCFAMELWGFAVSPCADTEELACVVELLAADVVLAVLPDEQARELLLRAREQGIAVLMLDVKRGREDAFRGNLSLEATAAPVEVRYWLRILAARKRGPKKAGSERGLEREAIQARVS